MQTAPKVVALLLSVLFAGSANAAHITDKLVVGMYPQPGPQGSPLKLLSSGTPIEVLEKKDGYTQVRLADDTEGWVSSSYVTEEKPAKAMLLEAQAKLRQMGIELAALREQQEQAPAESAAAGPTGPSERETELAESLGRAEERIAELERELAAQPAETADTSALDDLQSRVDQAVNLLGGTRLQDIESGLPAEDEHPIMRYRYWILGVGAAVLGFIAGAGLVDYRFRRRHGGFRF